MQAVRSGLVARAGGRKSAVEKAHRFQGRDRTSDALLRPIEIRMADKRAPVNDEYLQHTVRVRVIAGQEGCQNESGVSVPERRQGGCEPIPHVMGQAIAPPGDGRNGRRQLLTRAARGLVKAS
jgi:hypothetical protein